MESFLWSVIDALSRGNGIFVHFFSGNINFKVIPKVLQHSSYQGSKIFISHINNDGHTQILQITVIMIDKESDYQLLENHIKICGVEVQFRKPYRQFVYAPKGKKKPVYLFLPSSTLNIILL